MIKISKSCKTKYYTEIPKNFVTNYMRPYNTTKTFVLNLC